MKRELAAAGLILLALGVVAGAVRALDLIGGETLRLLALVLAVPLGMAVMALGVTPRVRAWRTPTTPSVERHVIREARLHTIDDRGSLPGARMRHIDLPLCPGLHSSEWRSGLLDDGRRRSDGQGWDLGGSDQAPTPTPRTTT